MKLIVFGLTISSSWGNGHATLWRGLVRALARRGWTVVFFERDRPYYAGARDLYEIDGGELHFYGAWEDVLAVARRHLADADVALVSSYCPDGIAASELVLSAPRAIRVFYDLDTPVTLSMLERGEATTYIGPRGLKDFDLVLSYTGGEALDALRDRLGAARVAPLYGHVDPSVHRPTTPMDHYRADLSYIGTYAEDRQAGVSAFLLEPARRRPHLRFVIAGAQYPQDFPWADNIFFVRHLPPE
jgi:spore maturation protein CgeB